MTAPRSSSDSSVPGSTKAPSSCGAFGPRATLTGHALVVQVTDPVPSVTT